MPSDIGPVCLTHLEFMKWADEKCLAALLPLPAEKLHQDLGSSFKSMFDTLNHLYLAEYLWLKRVQGVPHVRFTDLESPADPESLGAAWPGVHTQWIQWAHALPGENWAEPLTFRNLAGVEDSLPVWQIALHVVNHGSYHRGQVATMLRQSSIAPPGTDLVTFYRTR